MAERNPVVSVIIPTYLEEETIGGCLRCIAHQDFDCEIETIVVDSHSPDRTREVAAASDCRVFFNNAEIENYWPQIRLEYELKSRFACFIKQHQIDLFTNLNVVYA